MSQESDGVGDRQSWINTSVDVDTPLLTFMENLHTWRLFFTCRSISIVGGSALRLKEMKNKTKHQCKISCSSPITCYTVYVAHLPKQIR